MKTQKNKALKISSFAAPTETDIAAFEAMSASQKRLHLKAEIENALQGVPDKISTDDIIASASARLADA